MRDAELQGFDELARRVCEELDDVGNLILVDYSSIYTESE